MGWKDRVFFRYRHPLHRSAFRRRVCLAAVAGVIILISLGCQKPDPHHAQKDEKPMEVAVVTAIPRNVPVSPEYVAQVQSSRQVNIQARVNGFLDRRVYTEGAIVKEGETLFLMDQKPFKVQLDQAKAALAKQEAALEVARRNLARVKPLAAAKALSQKDLDDAIGQFQSASAAVDQSKATVAQAMLNLSYTVIKSPVHGITSAAQQADGTYLGSSNSQLTTVAVLSPTYVNFSISENERLKYRDEISRGLLLEPKDRNYVVEIVLADGSVFPYSGKVTFADPSFNAQTGTFLIRATVENPDGLLRPNQYVRIRLKGAVRPNAILVPQRAVQQTAKGHLVWLVNKESRAEPRPVTVGDWYGDEWFIYDGLHAGDQIVVDGTLTLRPGTLLKAVSPQAKPVEAGAGPSPAAEAPTRKAP
ncbi:efflux RND transporter periplasmic adaptor subunit [Desulforhabdus sp. TSK]|uniref:efflux RND transporter periplasmic adaptor subunit n=1 Tax=Desulforhabdus sp. TSK TaxID=2925014 RepID=UPI001FC7C0AC|nr:efflux RND transporter periplasmic adaptor subunit [Desulforhabdus sp. TSK]GKT10785.1 MexE family multidrug efflux RND transporter periplasmic adaptor subunit [Desulforhabdus sp. TSK]